MNLKNIRKQFPLLCRKHFIYFDNSASALKPKMVAEAENDYNLYQSVNVGRGIYHLAYEVSHRVADIRTKMATFIHANLASEIVFTKNTTEGLNMVANGLEHLISKNDEIVVTPLEHHSNFLPWVELCKRTGAKLIVVELGKDNKITLNGVKKVLTQNTKIVAITALSNVTGTQTPVREIVRATHKVGAIAVVDAAQAISHMPLDVKQWDCDFLAFSGYKMFAPTGVGILYGKQAWLEKLTPTNFGGGMVLDADPKTLEYRPLPERLEAGTLPVGAIMGLGKAMDFVEEVGYEFITTQDTILKNYMIDELSKISAVELYNKNADVPIVIFNIKGVHAHDVATMYDELGICVRAGNHCAQPAMQVLGQTATVRASLLFYNTTKEIDAFITATKQIIQFFSKF